MRFFILVILILSSLPSFGKDKSDPLYSVTYNVIENGELQENNERSFLFKNNIAYLTGSDSKIESFTDFTKNENIIRLSYKNKLYKNKTALDSLDQPDYLEDTETILKFKCNHAVFHSFSNTIDVWYTENSEIKGSLYSRFLPTKNSLVLKIRINGNREFIATSIEETTEHRAEYDPLAGIEVSASRLEELKIKSRYTVLNIFNREQINFDPSIKKPVLSAGENDITYHTSNGSVILKKITVPELVNQGAYVHAKLTNYSNGDAYDRTGSVFLIPHSTETLTMIDALEKGIEVVPAFTDKEENIYQGFISDMTYNCPIELMRFFTSFGVGHFNNLRPINNFPWADSVVYNQEITSLIPTGENEIWIGVFIGNYDKGGHRVSLDLNIYPSFEPSKKEQRWVQPLFNTLNIMEMSGQNYGKLFGNDTLRLSFEIPENVDNVNLLYTATGHGGWGNGDEFNPKMNQIRIDGKPFYTVVPWRTDCATYRLSNPASGNFENGLSSSDLSRSNWCPATVTPPYLIPLKDITPGKHNIEVIIDQGENEGNSFSHWSVSGVLVGEEKD